MSASVKRQIRRVIYNAVESMGFAIVRKGWDTARLRKDFRISTLIDVGIGSVDGTPELYGAFPDCDLLLVDPSPLSWPVMDRILQTRSGFSGKMAAGPETGSLDFNFYPDASNVSSFMVREEHANLRKEIVKVEVEPLDVIVQRSGLTGPFGLKIDTEGFELATLRGAEETLANTEFVLFESQIQALEPKPYSQGEIVAMLEAAGFELYDIVWVAYDHASLRTKQADFLFRKRG